MGTNVDPVCGDDKTYLEKIAGGGVTPRYLGTYQTLAALKADWPDSMGASMNGSWAVASGTQYTYSAGAGWVATQTASAVPTGDIWAACGDSITNGSSAVNFRYSWFPKLVNAFGGLIRNDSLECGVSGTTSAYAANTTVPAAIAAGAKKFILAVGMNDSADGNAISSADYMANIASCYRQIAAIGGLLFVVTPTPRGSGAAAQGRLRGYRKALIANREKYGYYLIDGFAALLDTATGYLAASFDSGDGVHPNDAGHEKLFQVVAQEVNRVYSAISSRSFGIVVAGDADSAIVNGTFPNASNWYEQPGGSGATATQSLVADTSGRLTNGQWLQRVVTGASSRTLATSMSATFADGDVLLLAAKIQIEDTSGNWETNVVAGTAGIGFQILNNSAVPKHQRLIRDAGVKNKTTRFYDIEIFSFVTGLGVLTNPLLWFAQSVPAGGDYKFRVGEAGIYNATALGLVPENYRGNEVYSLI